MKNSNTLCISETIQKLFDAKVFKTINDKSELFPFSIQPVVISRQCFEAINRSTYLWQKLIHLASLDADLINKILDLCKDEGMVQHFLQVFSDKAILNNELKKPKLELCRCDYFFDRKIPKLIEYNTCCVAMAGISEKIQTIFRENREDNQSQIPVNNSTKIFAQSVCDFYQRNKISGIFLAVVLPREANINDQNILLEFISSASQKNQEIETIKCHKVLYDQFMQQTLIDQNEDLIYQGMKVGIVYFRAGYCSKFDLTNNINKRIGRSSVISIPWLGSWLINTKRMQLEISKKEVMQKYLSTEQVLELKSSVIQSWDFSPPNDEDQHFEKIIKMVEQNGKDLFVLKPNQEGGGNNFFGLQAYEKLKSLKKEERVNYILTSLVIPEENELTEVRASAANNYKTQKLLSNSQFSIYGSITSDQDGKIQNNAVDGFLVRNKQVQCNQGGLMCGRGFISALGIKN